MTKNKATMPRLIDGDALKNEMVTDLANTMRMQEMHKGDMALRVLNKIDEAPTIDAEPVRHGRWGIWPAVWSWNCKVKRYLRMQKRKDGYRG